MAAGFLILRLLLFWIVSDATYSYFLQQDNSGYRTALQDGGNKRVPHYGNRRPLHYIQTLRQPHTNLQPIANTKTWQNPQGFMRTLGNSQVQRQMRPHQPQQRSYSTQQRSYSSPQQSNPIAQPKGFQISLDIPFLNLENQNKITDSVVEGYDYGNYNTETRKRLSTVNHVSSGFEASQFVDHGNKDYTKYSHGGKTNEIPKSSIRLNFTIPLSVESLNPSKSNTVHDAGPTKPLSKFVQNAYMKPEKQKWHVLNRVTQEPTLEQMGQNWQQPTQQQTGQKWHDYSWAPQKPTQQQTGQNWPDYSRVPQEPTQQQTVAKWPDHSQVVQEPTQQQTGQKWRDYSRVPHEPTQQQTGAKWPDSSQVVQEPTQQQTGQIWPNYSQAPQEPTQQQTGAKWPDYSQVVQEPTQQQTGAKWPDHSQVVQEPTQQQTGAKWPDHSQVVQEPTQQQTGHIWPNYSQAPQEPTQQQTVAKWPDHSQVVQEPTQQQTGAKWPDYSRVAQEPTQQQTGQIWPNYSQAPQEPTQQQTGAKWPDYRRVAQEPTQQQTVAKWPDHSQVVQEPTQQQTGQNWPNYRQAPQEPTQQETGQNWHDYSRVPHEPTQQQTGAKWPDYSRVAQEPTQQQTGQNWPDHSRVAQEPTQQQTGQNWPNHGQVAQEPTQQQTGTKWPDHGRVAQEPTQQQTGANWPDHGRVAQEPTQQQTGQNWPNHGQVAQEPTQQQTGAKWPDHGRVAQEPTQQQTGQNWPNHGRVAQEPTQQQTGTKWPDHGRVAQEPTQQQTGAKWPDHGQVAQEPTQQQTGANWPDHSRVAQEPTQQQMGQNWPDYSRVPQELTQQKTGSKWSIFNLGYAGPQTQQAKEPTFSSWNFNLYKDPQQAGNEKSIRLSWGLQKQGETQPASQTTVNYSSNLGIFEPQTSSSKDGGKEPISKPNIMKLHFSAPFQFNSEGSDLDNKNIGAEPNNYHTQGNERVPGTNLNDVTEEAVGKESSHEIAIPSIKLGFSLPIFSKLSNVTQKQSDNLVNIKPENTVSISKESAKAQSKPTQMKWPILRFEHAKNQKPQEQAENKLPLLNLDALFQQTKQPNVPIWLKPTDGKSPFSSWHSNQPVNQEKTLIEQSKGVQKPEMNKPQSPILSIKRYLQLDDKRPLINDQTVQPKPSQHEMAHSSLSSSRIKPSGNTYTSDQTRHPGSNLLRFVSKLNDLFKPIAHEQNAETEHHSSHLHSQSGYDLSFESPKLNDAQASKNPQTWKKEASPYFSQYNHGQKASETSKTPSFHLTTSRYQPGKKSLGLDTEHNPDNKSKSGKLLGGDGLFDGWHSSQTLKTPEHHGEWSERNTAGTSQNFKSPLCDSSSSSSEQNSFRHQFNSPSYKESQSGVAECPNKPEKYEPSYKIQVNYSPSAEATVVSDPSAFQPVLSGSISHTFPSLFNLKQYNTQSQQPLRSK